MRVTRRRRSHAPRYYATLLHDARHDVVADQLEVWGSRSIVDLGCGSGALIARLLDNPGVRRVLGVDRCPLALAEAHYRLASTRRWPDRRVALREGCVTGIDDADGRFDAAVAVETIEHLRPARLSEFELAIFARLRPRHVLITTPNRDYNPVLGLAPGESRHAGHRFEWGRHRFGRWAEGVAARNGFDFLIQQIGPVHASYGAPTQMALFTRH